MVGRAIGQFAVKQAANPHGELALRVSNLSREGVFGGITFDAHKGEVLCLSGLIGSRRTDVGLAIFGVEPATSGDLEIFGRIQPIRKPQDAMALGIAYVSEDRRKLGLAVEMPVISNITLANLRRFLRRFGLLDVGAEREVADVFRTRLDIRTPSLSAEVGKLSGGNQQKVMLAKWLETSPRILILDEPTRGIDIGAKAEVHGIVRELAAAGVAIILISSDLPEVLALADRIIVMREGRQMGAFDIADATPERIMALATGQAGGDQRRLAS
jgi:rhamnose transport system ATP-binding protein